MFVQDPAPIRTSAPSPGPTHRRLRRTALAARADRRLRRPAGVFAFLTALAATACADVPTETDRAGGIVSSQPQWAPDQVWQVADEPRVVLGDWRNGGESFWQVRAAARLPEDRIAVADESVASVRIFDLSGRLVQELGREGQGPGEFRSVSHVSFAHDTIRVGGRGLGRVNLFDPSGAFLDSYQLPSALAGPSAIDGLFPNGDALAAEWVMGSHNGRIRSEGPLPPDSTIWYRVRRSDQQATRIGSAIRMESYAHPWAGNLTRGEVIFGGRAYAALVGDTLFVARGGDDFRIDLVTEGDHIAGWFGLDTEPRPTTLGEREQYIQWRLDHAGDNVDKAGWARVFKDAPMRDLMPATGAIFADPDGNVWVEHFGPPGEPHDWAVFDPDHRWLGNVTLPADHRVTEIGDDYILAVHRDDFGIETVRYLEVVKP